VLKNDFIIFQNSVGMTVMRPKKTYGILIARPQLGYGILFLFRIFKPRIQLSLHTGLHNVYAYGIFKKHKKKPFFAFFP